MRVKLNIIFMIFFIFSLPELMAQNIFLDEKIKETIDDSINDLNIELRKTNKLKEELGYPQEISNEMVELQVDQSILDSVCVDCPKLSKLATQVNSALKNLVSTSSLKESNLALELQNLECHDLCRKRCCSQKPISSMSD